jgi:Zn-dependent protease with chaperone function
VSADIQRRNRTLKRKTRALVFDLLSVFFGAILLDTCMLLSGGSFASRIHIVVLAVLMALNLVFIALFALKMISLRSTGAGKLGHSLLEMGRFLQVSVLDFRSCILRIPSRRGF